MARKYSTLYKVSANSLTTASVLYSNTTPISNDTSTYLNLKVSIILLATGFVRISFTGTETFNLHVKVKGFATRNYATDLDS
jgi:hypothetical protein